MNARSFYKVANDVYTVSIYTQDWSENDRKLMEKFGEPEIDLGGSFGTGGSAYTLPTRLARILSASPFVQSFDLRDYVTAEAMANTWGDAIVDRIDVAITALRAESDTFTREEVENI